MVPFSSGEPTPWELLCTELQGPFLPWEHWPFAARSLINTITWMLAFIQTLEWHLNQAVKWVLGLDTLGVNVLKTSNNWKLANPL